MEKFKLSETRPFWKVDTLPSILKYGFGCVYEDLVTKRKRDAHPLGKKALYFCIRVEKTVFQRTREQIADYYNVSVYEVARALSSLTEYKFNSLEPYALLVDVFTRCAMRPSEGKEFNFYTFSNGMRMSLAIHSVKANAVKMITLHGIIFIAKPNSFLNTDMKQIVYRRLVADGQKAIAHLSKHPEYKRVISQINNVLKHKK